MNNIFYIGMIVFLTAGGSPGYSQTIRSPLILSETLDENIYKYAQYWTQPSGMDAPVSVRNLDADLFSPLTSNNIVLSAANQATWVTFKVLNESNSSGRLHLSFSPAYLGEIIVYNNGVPASETGSLSSANRKTPNLSTSLSIPPGSSDISIQIKSVGSAISILAQSDSVYQEEKSVSEIVFFFLFGAIAILTSYHLFIFFTSRHLVYLYYVLYGLSLIGAQLTLTNFSRYLFDAYVFSFPIGYLGSLLFANLGFLSIAQFSWTLLQLDDHAKWKRYGIRLCQTAATLNIMILTATHHHAIIMTTRALGLSTLMLLIAIGISEAKLGNKTAKLFLISWTPIFASIGMIVMVLNGVVAPNTWTNWSLSIGAVFESLLLAMAIGNRLEIATREKIQEQNLKIKAYEQIEENFEKLRKRDEVIRSFVSPTILTEVALKKDPLQYKPQFVEKSIMFTDLRGYTSLTERLSPAEAGSILNLFFGILNESIFENNGEVDKLIGDAVMATFSVADDCLSAVTSFRQKLAAANRDRVAQGLTPIRTGTGITHGTVLSANFGTQHKLDRTIVGDLVNLSSRLEGLTKEFYADVICSESFALALTGSIELRPLNWVRVKGKSEQVLIYEIYNHATPTVKEIKTQHGHVFGQIIEMQRNNEASKALSLLDPLIAKCPTHTYLDNEILDPTLRAIRNILTSQISQQQGAGNDRQAA